MAINPRDIWGRIIKNGLTLSTWPGTPFYAFRYGRLLTPGMRIPTKFDAPGAATIFEPFRLIPDCDDTSIRSYEATQAASDWLRSPFVPSVRAIDAYVTISGLPTLTDLNTAIVACVGLKSGGALASSGGINLGTSYYWYAATQVTQATSAQFKLRWYPNVLCVVVTAYSVVWLDANYNLVQVDSNVSQQQFTPQVSSVVVPAQGGAPSMRVQAVGSVVSAGCPGIVVPGNLRVTFAGGSGMDGVYGLGYDGVSAWKGTNALPPLNNIICTNRNLSFYWNPAGSPAWNLNVGGAIYVATAAACDPFSVSFTAIADCTGGSAATATVTR